MNNVDYDERPISSSDLREKDPSEVTIDILEIAGRSIDGTGNTGQTPIPCGYNLEQIQIGLRDNPKRERNNVEGKCCAN